MVVSNIGIKTSYNRVFNCQHTHIVLYTQDCVCHAKEQYSKFVVYGNTSTSYRKQNTGYDAAISTRDSLLQSSSELVNHFVIL